MAEMVLKDMAQKAGLAREFTIDSAATSSYERGNPIYPPARRELARRGIPCGAHASRTVTRADYDRFDWIFAMDEANLRALQRLFDGDPQRKVRLLLAECGPARDISDPWYTGDFFAAYRDIEAGCRAVLRRCAPKEGV